MRYSKLAHNAVVLVCGMALALVSVFGLAACANEEEAVKTAVTAQLDSLKSADADTVKQAVGDDLWNEMESYGIDPKEFYDAILKNFSYDNVQVKVNGDKATVSLTVTNVDFNQVASQWESDVTSYLSSSEAYSDYLSMGEDGMMQKVMQSLIDAITASDAPMKTGDVSFDMQKVNGQWEPTDSSQLSTLVYAGDDPSQSLSADLAA